VVALTHYQPRPQYEQESMSNELAALKQEITKGKIIEAFTRYRNREPGSGDNLFKVVREFAYSKMYRLEIEFHDFGTSDTADDAAQEAVIAVWQGLGNFKGETGRAFYSWVNRICYSKRVDFFNEVKAQKTAKQPLVVSVSDESGETREEDNPEIYEDKGASRVTFTIPDSVQGVDKSICDLILCGFDYARIGKELNLTPNAVEIRLRKLRNRLADEHEEAKRSAQIERDRQLRERNRPFEERRREAALHTMQR
jgi:RNA polymerase sigma factor (sigma-70 family)